MTESTGRIGLLITEPLDLRKAKAAWAAFVLDHLAGGNITAASRILHCNRATVRRNANAGILLIEGKKSPAQAVEVVESGEMYAARKRRDRDA